MQQIIIRWFYKKNINNKVKIILHVRIEIVCNIPFFVK